MENRKNYKKIINDLRNRCEELGVEVITLPRTKQTKLGYLKSLKKDLKGE